MWAEIWSWLQSGLILGGPVPLCLWLVGLHQRQAGDDALARGLASVLTLWCLMLVCLGLGLGSLHELALRPVLAITVTMAVTGVLLLRRSTRAGNRSWRFWTSSGQRPLQRDEKAILALLALVALALLDRIAAQPFTDYDSLWFHGPIITRWYQTASLSQSDVLGHWIIERPNAQGYPYNWHVLSVFCVLPWGQDIFMALPMLIAWAIMGLSTYLLGRHVGADRFHAMAGAALVLLMPFLLNQVTTLHIDLPFAAIYGLSLYYLVSYHASRRGWEAFLCLASAGLMAGIKTTGIIYAAFIVGLCVLSTVLPRFRASGLRPPSRPSLVVAGGLLGLALSCFWYVSYGVAPIHTTSASVVTARMQQTFGIQELWRRAMELQSTTLTAEFNWFDGSHWMTLLSQALARFQLPLVALTVAAMAFPRGWQKASRDDRRRRIGFLLLFLVTFFIYWNTPYSSGDETSQLSADAGATAPSGTISPLVGYNMRYAFPALGLLGAVAAISVTTLGISSFWVTLVVWFSALSGMVSSSVFDKVRAQSLSGQTLFWPSRMIGELFHRPGQAIASLGQFVAQLGITDICIYVAVSLAVLAVYVAGRRRTGAGHAGSHGRVARSARWRVWPAFLLIGTGLLAVTPHWSRVRDAERTKLFRDVDGAIAQALAPGRRIAYFSSGQSYLLYGKHLDNEVIHLPPDMPGVGDWVAVLRRARVALVATGPGRLSEARIDALAAAAPAYGPLTEIPGHTADQWLRLYRLTE